LLREFFRLHKACLPPSSDILFIAKPGAGRVNPSGLREELEFLLGPDKPF
ncbi:MAG: ribonuclease P protein component, partial [Deltaproteobacteria bacterium]|nr:ribonuclease P protein component [Deltaproteobacteria bacterium]